MKVFLSYTLVILFSLFFKELSSQSCGCVKVIFVVDNSGSITSTEFDEMKASIDDLGTQILADYDQVNISVVQYATNVNYVFGNVNHLYDVSIPFTNDPVTLVSWSRNYGTGTPNPDVYEDHLPGSLQKMKSDGVWSSGGALDLQTETCATKFFLFTDAAKSMPGGCCSVLKNLVNAPAALPNYEEYNYLKTTYDATFVVYHVAPDPDAEEAGAAIASVGGVYNGLIDDNVGDPEGDGAIPRLYNTGNFNLSQPQIDEIIANIDPTGEGIDFAAPDTVCLGEIAIFHSEGAPNFDNILWDFGDGSNNTSDLYIQHEYKNVGNYTVRHTYDKDDCNQDIIKEVVVEVCLANKFRINIPNTFTPDGDGINDLLEIHYEGVAEAEFFVFNRWGQKVYSTKNLDEFWNGKFKNINADQGVYVYRLVCRDIYSKPHEFLGHISLLR